MPKIKVSLAKTSKILNDLKALKNKVSPIFGGRYNTKTLSAFSISTDKCVSDLSNIVDERLSTALYSFELTKDINLSIANTKKALFKGNISSGVSDLIEDLAELELNLELFESVTSITKPDNALTLPEITSSVFSKRVDYAESKGEFSIAFNIAFIDFTPSSDDITNLKKQIIALREKKILLNIQTMIEFDLPENIIKELML